MGIIRGMLEEEFKRLEELSVFYKEKISECPRGSISVKERGGKRYIYLVRREDKNVVFLSNFSEGQGLAMFAAILS